VGRGGDWRRRRFSIAHELGHWHHHRGRISSCELGSIETQIVAKSRIEREADDYAAKLLMPAFLFTKSVRARAHRTLGVVAAIAYEYRTSRLATLLRIIDLDLWPCMVVCRPSEGRGWSRKSGSFQIPGQLRKEVFLNCRSPRAGPIEKSRRNETDVAEWFETQPSPQVRLEEQSCRAFRGGVLTLLISSCSTR
jgi:hypothetical protein